MSITLWLLVVILTFWLSVAGIVLVRTFLFQPPRAQNLPPLAVKPASPKAIQRLSQAIRIPTVCAQNYTETNFAPFNEYISFIKGAFPLFCAKTQLTQINGYALMFRWQGHSSTKKPIMLTAHYDVVPIESGTEDDWKYSGFSGTVAEGRVWGRGTLDIKSQMLAQIEAAENLMRENFVPERDFLFVYGQDEEIGGRNGAALVAEYLEKNGIELEGVLDEGGIAIKGALKGVSAPLALVGVGEKGLANFEISLPGTGGHSSTPPKHTALGSIAQFIYALEKTPMKARLTPPVEEMLRNISGEMGFVVRMAVCNLWLFRGLLLKVLSKAPATNALVRTTFAATMASASNAANVLPQKASATINARLLAGNTLGDVETHFQKLAGGKATIKRLVASEASYTSPTNSDIYNSIKTLITHIYPNVIVSPYLVMGGTDSRKYYNVCKHIYRFTPMLITNEENSTMHSTNESVSIENYSRMIYFYEKFISDFDV